MHNFRFFIISILSFNFCVSSFAMSSSPKEKSDNVFTYERFKNTRGGTTRGPKIKKDYSIDKIWNLFKTPNLSKKDKDAIAIQTLAGQFKANFEFLETINLIPTNSLDTPYKSWGTEFIQIIKKTDSHLSLQHIMVMKYVDPKTNKEMGPFVMKHWRQDWTWEGTTCLTYLGKNKWSNQKLKPSETKGKWVWHVYQVDDSPRYCGVGSWNHFESASVFTTDYMQRPLPRRERTIRKDYDVLLGMDTIITTPNSWYHEQKSFKQKKKFATPDISQGPFLAREIGHNTYSRIKDYDFSLGKSYWKKTEPFWKDVKEAWSSIITSTGIFGFETKSNGEYLFSKLFEQAENDDVLKLNSDDRKKLIKETITKFVSPLEDRI